MGCRFLRSVQSQCTKRLKDLLTSSTTTVNQHQHLPGKTTQPRNNRCDHSSPRSLVTVPANQQHQQLPTSLTSCLTCHRKTPNQRRTAYVAGCVKESQQTPPRMKQLLSPRHLRARTGNHSLDSSVVANSSNQLSPKVNSLSANPLRHQQLNLMCLRYHNGCQAMVQGRRLTPPQPHTLPRPLPPQLHTAAAPHSRGNPRMLLPLRNQQYESFRKVDQVSPSGNHPPT